MADLDAPLHRLALMSADEDDHPAFPARLGIVRLHQAIGADIPVEDMNIDGRVQLLELERVFDGRGAAGAAARGALLAS